MRTYKDLTPKEQSVINRADWILNELDLNGIKRTLEVLNNKYKDLKGGFKHGDY